MQEATNPQSLPVKVYRTHDHLTVAAPMPGLEPEDILVEVTEQGQLILHGDRRGSLKEVKEVLLDEWNVARITVNSSSQSPSMGNMPISPMATGSWSSRSSSVRRCSLPASPLR